MITRLFIRNLILIEQATLQFGKGLNILSGETGAGKSAILAALGLIAGKRTDSSLVRKGADKAIVEAVFDIDGLSDVKRSLDEAGIAYEEGDELIITREIQASGKGRIFINNQSVPSAFLKKLGSQMVEIVSQHATQSLFSLEYHRLALDLFGGLHEKVQLFTKEWAEEKEMSAELQRLESSEAFRQLSFERFQKEQEEIAEAELKEGEDEELFAEYTRLVQSEDISAHCQGISEAFDEVLPPLKGIKQSFDQLLALDPSFKENAEIFKGVIAELEEISFTIGRSVNSNGHDSEKINRVNKRLTQIAQLKKKYGATLLEIERYLKQLDAKIEELEKEELKLEELQLFLPKQQEKTNLLARELTSLRSKALAVMQEQMTAQLRELNMPNASFSISLTSQKRSGSGDDGIEWFMAPNLGEHLASIRECASGGELSRVMLALQALLAGKDETPTLLFDEIDGNIGGETAAVVGEKLKQISKEHQVLCVTHFPQVARQADHHFRIQKQEVEGRTLTLVDELKNSERESELQRMLGMSKTQVAKV